MHIMAESYYKGLSQLVPYDVENVRIRYYGDNIGMGQVAGLDLRLNGEFLPGAESWINVSFLKAVEKWDDVDHEKLLEGENNIVPTRYVRSEEHTSELQSRG